MNQPKWLTWAKSKIGIHEIPGPRDNSEIVSWFKFTSLDHDQWHDATPWCAVFANAALGLNGTKGTGSAAAISFSTWGHEVEYPDALPGDIVVFEWDSGQHHVAIFEAQDDDRVKVVGGNQGATGEVSEAWHSKDDVVNVRRA